MLTKIEKKMVEKFMVFAVRDCGNAGFILSNGPIVNTTDHATLCKTIGCSLSKIIQDGVCRFMFREGKEGKIAAFEYTSLTAEQKTTIGLLLRADDFYVVITAKTVISKFRPIRKIKF